MSIALMPGAADQASSCYSTILWLADIKMPSYLPANYFCSRLYFRGDL
jgi:hypothetical protein